MLLSVIPIQPNTSRGYSFGLEGPYFNESVIFSLLIALLFLISVFEVLTLKDYKEYIIKRPHVKKGSSYLTLKNIFDNENRLNILKEILTNPGVHQNELLRDCNLQKGQLQWHLDVLLKNGVIKKEKLRQYRIYFPITSSIEAIENFKNLPTKSKTTEKVFDIIQKNPGISSSEISTVINLARNTVKYHVDKLSGNRLIVLKKKGRKIQIYSNE
jgi:predicted transcriptional regulator